MFSQINMFKKRPRMNSLTLIAVTALFITLFQNVVYYKQTLLLINIHQMHQLLFFLSMPVTLFTGLNIVINLVALPGLRKPLLMLLLLIGAGAQYFMWTYGIVIDRDMIENVMNTTPAESLALLTPQLIFSLLGCGVLPALFIAWVTITPQPLRWLTIGIYCLNLIVSLLVILLISMLFYKDYASVMRNNKDLIKNLVPSNVIVAGYSYNKHRMMKQMPFTPIGLDAKKQPARTANGKKNLVILFVGETSRAMNYSLGGYSQLTNPRLAQDKVIYYPAASSCGTSTAISVPCMFSDMTRGHYDAARAVNQDNLVDILQRAQVNVLWRDNDGGCQTVCARVKYEDVTSLKLPGYCADGTCYDQALLHDLDAYIQQQQNDTLIVLHMIGSHGPTYYRRYPPAFRKFTPTCDTNEIQTCSQQQLVNSYDNTVLYSDNVLDQAITILKSHQDKFNTALVYLSDHGESLGEKGVYLHGMPYAIAPQEQTHVPVLMWLSAQYRQANHIDQDCLTHHADQPISQDNLFHTLLGLFNISTGLYQPALDLTRDCHQ